LTVNVFERIFVVSDLILGGFHKFVRWWLVWRLCQSELVEETWRIS